MIFGYFSLCTHFLAGYETHNDCEMISTSKTCPIAMCFIIFETHLNVWSLSEWRDPCSSSGHIGPLIMLTIEPRMVSVFWAWQFNLFEKQAFWVLRMGKCSWVHTVEPYNCKKLRVHFLSILTKPTWGALMFQVIFQTLFNSVTPASMNWEYQPLVTDELVQFVKLLVQV